MQTVETIERECACGNDTATVGDALCVNNTPVTTYTCARCGHSVWSCELDPASPCRR